MRKLLLLSTLVNYYDAAALVEGSTKHRCRVAMKTLIRCHGDVPAKTLSPRMIARWQLWCRAEGMSSATIRSGFTAIAQVYRWAVRQEPKLLVANPFVRAEKLKADKREVRTLQPDELADLCRAAAEWHRQDMSAQMRWYVLLSLAGHSGPRIGEILNLRWEDIDLERGLLHIVHRRDKYGEHWEWGSKTRVDRRVPIGQDVFECCHRLREVATWRYPLLKRVTCERLQHQVGSIAEHIRKLPYPNLYREFRQIRARANVGRRTPIKNGGFHLLRKTAVTAWAASGVPLVAAQYCAGHASMQTTRTYYIAIDADRSIEQVRRNLP